MKRVGLVVMVLAVLPLMGCAAASAIVGDVRQESNTPTSSLPAEAHVNGTSPAPSQASVVLPQEPPQDRTWISPGKVEIGNFYPGARAEYPITVHNGKDSEASFAVTYRHPDNVATGYVKPPTEAADWVMIVDTTPVLAPQETRDILVVLAMPTGAEVFAPQWEFWVSVKDTTQRAMVQTELCSRWLITMRR